VYRCRVKRGGRCIGSTGRGRGRRDEADAWEPYIVRLFFG
jgi:hypothetical protein